MGLLEFAAKYLPELEKMAGQEEASKQSPVEVLKKQLKKKSSTKSAHLRAVKKNSGMRSQRGSHLRQGHHPPPFVPQWIPHHSLPPKIPPQPMAPPHCMPPQMPYAPYPPPMHRIRRRRQKISSNAKRELKTGTMISNVSNALEDFKKRRDKFLNYLAQLQDDLNKLNLPSASKERMEPREYEAKKKDAKRKKKKMHKTKVLSEPRMKKRLDVTTSEILQKKKAKSTKKESLDKKQKGNRIVAQSFQNLQEWKEE